MVWTVVLLEQLGVCCPNHLLHSAGLPAYSARVHASHLLGLLSPAPF